MAADAPESPRNHLQFDTVESGQGSAAGPVCAHCQNPIVSSYFEAGGQVVCESCRTKLEALNVSGAQPASFARAVLFGVGGAIAGAAVYYGVLATTGYEIGLIAILVGFMVGYMVRRGAGGLGGRRYQALALVLTYLAIGSTYVPLALQGLDGETISADAAAGAAPAVTEPVGESGGSYLFGIAALAVFAAALPVISVIGDLPASLISALIIGFALHQAWTMNRRIQIVFTGPYRVSGGT